MHKCVRRSLLLVCCAAFCFAPLDAAIRTLTILHTNDLHSRLSVLENRHGGFAYLAAAIARERNGCTDCILLNAGDLAQGSPVSTIYKGMPVFQIANMLGFNAGTLGNHDFDYGWRQARKFVRQAKYPIVSSNIVDANGRLLTGKPWVILKVNGLRVGVIGAMTDDLHNLSFPVLMGAWHTIPSVETTRHYAAELRSRCDIVVVLAHITGEEETAFLNTPETPVIVSGHIHSGLDKELSSADHVLVRVKSYGEELGRLELKIDTVKKAPVSWTWKKVVIDSDRIVPDTAVAAQAKLWEDKVSVVVDQPMATSNRQLSKVEVKALFEEAMKDAAGADLAYIQIGGIRDTLPKGSLLLRHAWNVMPFDNRLVIGTFKGRDLPDVVKKGQQIDPERNYKLAVSDFTAANQSSDENLRTTGLQFPGDAGLLRDALINYIRKRKVLE